MSQDQSADLPYLTVVAASRNDDHGGSLNTRTQFFVNGLLPQAERHSLPAELILVEWNPPADRPYLAQSLQFPADHPWLFVRIVMVFPHPSTRDSGTARRFPSTK